MKTRLTLLLSVTAGLALTASLLLRAEPNASAAAQAAQLERGRYLVENVGLCADCHSPRNEKGAFIKEQWLKGAALPFQPTVPMPWSPAAPPIAGLPSMTSEQAVHFLMTGERPDGSRPRPPMPEFKLNRADAEAMVAHLKSLTP